MEVSAASGQVFTHTVDSGVKKEFQEFFNRPLPSTHLTIAHASIFQK